jgi:hypothetical protein
MHLREAELIQFPDPKLRRQEARITRQRVFYLGYHEYAVNPLFAWQTEYWVKRIQKGRRWELYCTDPENTGRKRVLYGEFSPDDIRQYFIDVAFEITDDDWHAMGWRDFTGDNVLDFQYYYWEKYPDSFCDICNEMMPHDPFAIHECVE